jgi:hypothetical protein
MTIQALGTLWHRVQARQRNLERGPMEPRGQLWFELERVCEDFRAYSGLEEKAALQVLVAVLRNLLAEQEEDLAQLAGLEPAPDTPASEEPAS